MSQVVFVKLANVTGSIQTWDVVVYHKTHTRLNQEAFRLRLSESSARMKAELEGDATAHVLWGEVRNIQ